MFDFSYDYLCKLFYIKNWILYWKVSKGKAHSDQKAGCKKDGYIKVGINGKIVPVHRIIYILETGTMPNGQIDHINGIRDDNRIDNLRVVNNRQNHQNLAIHRAGHLPGTHFHKGNKKWVARIRINNKRTHLGYFDTEAEASNAYIDAVNNINKQSFT